MRHPPAAWARRPARALDAPMGGCFNPTMADLKNMTVQALRDLARKVLGRGYSRLKTKNELIAAIEAAQRHVADAAGKAAARVRDAADRATRATDEAVQGAAEKASRAGRAVREAGRAMKQAGRAARDAGRAAGKAARNAGRAAQQGAREVRESAEAAAAAAMAGARAARDAARGNPEAAGAPDPEGFFVARVRGEEAVREAPHPMTESAAEERPGELRAFAPEERPELPGPPRHEEDLGELPWGYGDDAFVALPRDPHTLFLYWDYAQQTLANGFAGLEDGRSQLWIYVRRGSVFERVRAVDFALESRSYYVHELAPGETYRAEVHLVDRVGRDRLLANPSNEAQLPTLGPSPIVDDRFVRIPWDVPLSGRLGPGHPGGPFSPEARAMLAMLSDWSRFPTKVWGGSAGGMGGRPFSPTAAPSSPHRPFGPEGK